MIGPGAWKSPRVSTLSYTWGPPTPTLPVLINGAIHHVRQNLHDFLLEACRRGHEHCTWIDQVSIAQEDPTERIQQVSMMHEIYRGADKVILWLGGSDKDSPRILSKMSAEHWKAMIKQWDLKGQHLDIAVREA